MSDGKRKDELVSDERRMRNAKTEVEVQTKVEEESAESILSATGKKKMSIIKEMNGDKSRTEMMKHE